jgi:hypothetical protein
MAKDTQSSEQRPQRPWVRDSLTGVGVHPAGAFSRCPLPLADGLAVLALLAYVALVIASSLIRKRRALALGLVTMLILELILAGLCLYEPLLTRRV